MESTLEQSTIQAIQGELNELRRALSVAEAYEPLGMNTRLRLAIYEDTLRFGDERHGIMGTLFNGDAFSDSAIKFKKDHNLLMFDDKQSFLEMDWENDKEFALLSACYICGLTSETPRPTKRFIRDTPSRLEVINEEVKDNVSSDITSKTEAMEEVVEWVSNTFGDAFMESKFPKLCVGGKHDRKSLARHQIQTALREDEDLPF